MDSESQKASTLTTWVILAFLVLFIFVKGFWVYFAIGDRGQPDWDYRPMKDVPGQSPYAIYETLPHPQHVRGAKGE